MKKLYALAFTIVIFGSFLIYHEMTHYQIEELHGCSDTAIDYTFSSIQVWCDGTYPSEEARASAAKLNALSEIIGYHLVPFLLLAWFVVLVRFI